MVSLMDLQIEIVRKFEKFRKNFVKHARRIKQMASQTFGDAEVYVFGSVVRNDCHPMSDVDLAVVVKDASEERRVKFYRRIRKEFGPLHPFEIHILTEEEWNNYRKFVGDFIKIEE